jgi:selenide,water dikinase
MPNPTTEGPLDSRRHLILVGGGHTHVHVLRGLAMRPEPGLRVTLVSPGARSHYSGMLPGRLAGTYDLEESSIDVAALAARAGAAFWPESVLALDLENRSIQTGSRGSIPYDLLSLDVGSRPRGIDEVAPLPAVVGVRPVEAAASRISSFVEKSRNKGRGRALVVGAGAGGLELAFALRRRLPRSPACGVTVVEAAEEILPSATVSGRRLVSDLLRTNEIDLQTGRRFSDHRDGVAILDDGTRVEADIVLWATGAEGLPFLARSGLQSDEQGFVLVDDHLRCLGRGDVFAVGDCARMEQHREMPRAGVYAVRQGPYLEANLRRAARGLSLVSYRPQKRFLSLLSTADGKAVFLFGGRAGYGRLWWRLKDWIDRRFIERYRSPAPARLRQAVDVAAEMPMAPCGGCAAKVEPDTLARVLSQLGSEGSRSPEAGAGQVPLGFEAADDAAILRAPPGDRLVFTVDAFPPFFSDLLIVGEVAAHNALSDIYAMGGTPTAALALVGVPSTTGAMQEADLRQLMQGAQRALASSGVPLAGGHSIETSEPVIGFAVLGSVDSGAILTKAGAQPGDLLVLTKALGTGVVLAASRAGECPRAWTEAALAEMLRSNGPVSRRIADAAVRCCTDISGFGLAGHLAEVLRASGHAAEIHPERVPALPGALDLLGCGWRSSASAGLDRSITRSLDLGDLAPTDPSALLLTDPQTSGGLLLAVSESIWSVLEAGLEEEAPNYAVIGRVVEGPTGMVRLLGGGLAGSG